MPKKLKIRSEQRKSVVPLGELIEGDRKSTIIKVEERFRVLLKKEQNFEFYLVGDVVAEDILNNPFLRKFVKLCIIDEKTQRDTIKVDIELKFPKKMDIKNPKGTISEESWDVIQKALESNEKVLIRVIEGEEDLLVLPLIMSLPLHEEKTNFVFYGQPPITDSVPPISQGIVVAEVNKRVKKLVSNFLEAMKKA